MQGLEHIFLGTTYDGTHVKLHIGVHVHFPTLLLLKRHTEKLKQEREKERVSGFELCYHNSLLLDVFLYLLKPTLDPKGSLVEYSTGHKGIL